MWPDGYIILKYLAIYNNENLPNRKTFLDSTNKILPNVKKSIKIAQDFNDCAKIV